MWFRGLQRRHGGADYHATEQQRGAGSKHVSGASAEEPLLPAQLGMPRKTLVLDLDRTLIDCILAREASSSQPDFLYTDEQGCSAKVWMRPFLKQFLSAVARDFEVVLFTAAGPRHADCVLRVLDPSNSIFSHRLYGHHTKECAAWGWVKDLSRLGRPMSSMLLVDDSLLAGLSQPCNLVPIRPFMHNDPKKDFDTALPELLRFLQDKVLPASDVRQIIGLHWNKITRRPRKRALRMHDSTRPSCSCTCHEQLRTMVNSSAPVPEALVAHQQQQVTGSIPIRATLVPAGSPDAVPTACVLVEQPSKQSPSPTHHKCPASGAGCGCMCTGADTQHVLAAVALWHRLSFERSASQQDDEADVCSCCDQGLPLLHPPMLAMQCARNCTEATQQPSTAPCTQQAAHQTPGIATAGAIEPQLGVKVGLHKSRTDWQLSSQLHGTRPPHTDGGSASALAAMDAAIANGSAGLSPLPSGPLTSFSSAPCGVVTRPAVPRSAGASSGRGSCSSSQVLPLSVAQAITETTVTRSSLAVASAGASVAAQVPAANTQATPMPHEQLQDSMVQAVINTTVCVEDVCTDVPAMHQGPSNLQHTPFSHVASWQQEQLVISTDATSSAAWKEASTQPLSLPLPAPPPAQDALAAPGFWYTGGQYTGVCFSASRMQWERVGIDVPVVTPVSTAVGAAWERAAEADTNSSVSSSSSATTRSGSSMLSVESCDLDHPGAIVKPTTPHQNRTGTTNSTGKMQFRLGPAEYAAVGISTA